LSVVASTTALVRHNLPPSQWAAGISAFTIVFAAGQIVGPARAAWRVVWWCRPAPCGWGRCWPCASDRCLGPDPRTPRAKVWMRGDGRRVRESGYNVQKP
jgi:hypothetical protein